MIEQIDRHNKELETVTEEYFDGQENLTNIYMMTEKTEQKVFTITWVMTNEVKLWTRNYQGKNIEYFENGIIKEIIFYKDGVPTGENYFFDINGNADPK